MRRFGGTPDSRRSASVVECATVLSIFAAYEDVVGRNSRSGRSPFIQSVTVLGFSGSGSLNSAQPEHPIDIIAAANHVSQRLLLASRQGWEVIIFVVRFMRREELFQKRDDRGSVSVFDRRVHIRWERRCR